MFLGEFSPRDLVKFQLGEFSPMDLAKFSTKIHHSQGNDTFSAELTGMTSWMKIHHSQGHDTIFANFKFKKFFLNFFWIFFFALFNSKSNSEKKKISCIFWLKTSFTFIWSFCDFGVAAAGEWKIIMSYSNDSRSLNFKMNHISMLCHDKTHPWEPENTIFWLLLRF